MQNSVIISGSSHELLTQEISNRLNIPLVPCKKRLFANTEWNFQITENIRNKDVFIIQTGTYDKSRGLSTNDFIIETVIMINACRYSSCGKITLIMPCYPYSRGDKKDEARTPISSRAIADILHVDRVVTMDLHSPQQQGFFGNSFKPIPVDNIYTLGLFRDYFNNEIFNDMTLEEKDKEFVIVSPDEGGIKRNLKIAGVLGIRNYEFCHKQRIFDQPGVVGSMKLLGISDLQNKTAIICDDMCDSGGTLMKCISLLVENGVKAVYCVITHGIFTKDALKNINGNPYIKKFIVTNTLPQHEHYSKCSKLEVLSVGNLLGDVIRCLCTGRSLSNLSCFDETSANENTHNNNLSTISENNNNNKLENDFKNFIKTRTN
jgi:ribose-phosphate pyrophosphokinase